MSAKFSAPLKHEQLRAVELFQQLSQAELDQILQAARPCRLAVEEFLFYQEDPAERFYLLLEGRLKLTQLSTEGLQVILRYANPGEAFGIVAVLSEINYPITAQAVEDSRLISWEKMPCRR